ncbi:MAG: hypothetical protein DWQ01_12315 [Planctomycetota bacterium]|nr:MAG: hypothetical protein DWQ01_12315 [Planctomycetota bacterium]
MNGRLLLLAAGLTLLLLAWILRSDGAGSGHPPEQGGAPANPAAESESTEQDSALRSPNGGRRQLPSSDSANRPDPTSDLPAWGRLLDAEGRPAAGARYHWVSRSYRPGARLEIHRSDEEGWLRAAPPATPRALAAYHPGGEGWFPWPGDPTSEPIPTWILPAGGEIAFQVENSAGEPLSGVRFWPRFDAADPGSKQRLEVENALRPTMVSGRDGRFRLPGLRTGHWRFAIQAPEYGELEREVLIEAGIQRQLHVQFETPAHLKIQVRTEQGESAPGILLELRSRSEKPIRGRSDAKGDLVLGPIPPGPARLFDFKDGQRPLAELELQPGLQQHTVVVRHRWSVEVWLEDDLGPVSGAYGLAMDPGAPWRPERWAALAELADSPRSDADGRLRLGPLLPGEYRIVAGRRQSVPAEALVSLHDRNASLRLRLQGQVLRGRVLPVKAKARVSLQFRPRAEESASLSGLISAPKAELEPWIQRMTTVCDDEGRFAFTSIPWSEVSLQAEAEGFLPSEILDWSLQGGTFPEVEMELKPAIEVVLEITEVPQNLSRPVWVQVLDEADQRLGRLQRVDRRGFMHWQRVAPGNYRLQILQDPGPASTLVWEQALHVTEGAPPHLQWPPPP